MDSGDGVEAMQASTFDGSRAAFPVQSMGPCTAVPTPSPPPAPRDADIGCSVLVPRPKEKAPPSAPPPLPTSRTYGAPDLVPRTLAGASTAAASYTGSRHTPRPSQTAIAARLAAARPVVWKGQGELLQLPWPAEAKGLWLVVDLWSGCGGLIFALLSLGVRFIALCAERDECASACSRAVFPNCVQTTRVEDVTVDLFDNVAARRNFAGIIVGGGPSSQGNSKLDPGPEYPVDDTRRQHHHVARLRDELHRFNLPVLSFLEDVATLPQADVDANTRIMRCDPIAICAEDFGWVRRRRLVWLHGPRMLKPKQLVLPDGISIAATCDGARLLYTGDKPIPRIVRHLAGFSPPFAPSAVMKG